MCSICDRTGDDKGHVWEMVGDEVDYFAFEEGFHNGPRCVNCGYIFCHHCQDGPDEICEAETIKP